ncbi:MAG: deoxyribose-phosphate aldolase [Chthonomonadales bacterium]
MSDLCAAIAAMVDHSLLDPTLTDEALDEGCNVARRLKVASVCIKPYAVKRCAGILEGSGVRPSTVIGFPHGSHSTSAKVAEARIALDDGAGELDMVVNIGKVLSRDWDYVRSEIAAVVAEAHARGGLVKVIFENCYLTDYHKERLCEMSGEAGADFIKTSTGFGPGGATLHDLKLMLEHAPPGVKVKAAGGIRTLDQLLEVRNLGVARVGASRTEEILQECRRRFGAGQ